MFVFGEIRNGAVSKTTSDFILSSFTSKRSSFIKHHISGHSLNIYKYQSLYQNRSQCKKITVTKINRKRGAFAQLLPASASRPPSHLSAPCAPRSQRGAPRPCASFQNLLKSGLNSTRKVTRLPGRTRRKHKMDTAHFGPTGKFQRVLRKRTSDTA